MDTAHMMSESTWNEMLARATHCAATGIVFRSPEPSLLLRKSPDRIDNSKGYTEDNVRIVCYAANMARQSTSVEELDLFIASIRACEPYTEAEDQEEATSSCDESEMLP